jgi:uncharacterized protein YndB with AHSA1/START domain
MWKKILIGIGVVLLVLVVIVMLQPSTFHIERSTSIAAPPERAFSLVNDFRAWRGWSPWEELDPQLKRNYEGAPSGAGAKYSWSGNDEVGAGKMTIEQSQPPSRIQIKLEFLKPFEATNTTTFSFVPAGAGTKVIWAMDGNSNFMSKAFGLFMDMDQLVGKDFERGLAQMKSLAERSPPPDPAQANQ